MIVVSYARACVLSESHVLLTNYVCTIWYGKVYLDEFADLVPLCVIQRIFALL